MGRPRGSYAVKPSLEERDRVRAVRAQLQIVIRKLLVARAGTAAVIYREVGEASEILDDADRLLCGLSDQVLGIGATENIGVEYPAVRSVAVGCGKR